MGAIHLIIPIDPGCRALEGRCRAPVTAVRGAAVRVAERHGHGHAGLGATGAPGVISVSAPGLHAVYVAAAFMRTNGATAPPISGFAAIGFRVATRGPNQEARMAVAFGRAREGALASLGRAHGHGASGVRTRARARVITASGSTNERAVSYTSGLAATSRRRNRGVRR